MSFTPGEVLRLQDAAQAYYLEKNYSAAIANFTEALKHPDVPLTVQIGILGNRAAAREMIGGKENLERALLDFRLMMALLSDVQMGGYLHMGKLYELLGQDRSAMDVITEGAKHVKEFEALNTMLTKVHDRVVSRGAQETSRDPLKRLPTEVAEQILKCLTFQDLVVIQGVSRAWRRYIQARHETYTCLDFSTTLKVVPRISLQAYITHSAGNVREAVLCKFNNGSALSTIVNQCPQLSILRSYDLPVFDDEFLEEIRIAQNLTALCTDLWIRMSDLQEVLEGCPSLHTLECEAILPSPLSKVFTSLRCLKVSRQRSGPFPLDFRGEEYETIARCFPKLEEVDLSGPSFHSPLDFRSLESLSVLALVSSGITGFPLLPESIRSLTMEENHEMAWSRQEIAASPLPNLETLKVSWSPRVENSHVLAILEPSLEKRSLRSLHLNDCKSVDFNSLEWLVRHGENLEELAIGQNSAITDETVKELARFKKLRYLDMDGCGISTIGLMNVVNGSSGALREVDICSCHNIDKDAARLAAKSGVKIVHR